MLAPRSSAYPTVRIDRTGTWTLQREQPSGAPREFAGRARSRLPQFRHPHELPTDVWLRPEAYGERSSSSTPNYGNAEVYHLADYSDGDAAHNTEDLLSGRAAFRAGGVYEAPFHRPTSPAPPPAPATKATAKFGTRPAARGTVGAFFASSRGRVLSKARSSSPPRSAVPPARKASVPASSRPLALQTHLGDNRRSESHLSLLHQGEKATGSQIPHLGHPLRTGRRSTSFWTGTGCST